MVRWEEGSLLLGNRRFGENSEAWSGEFPLCRGAVSYSCGFDSDASVSKVVCLFRLYFND